MSHSASLISRTGVLGLLALFGTQVSAGCPPWLDHTVKKLHSTESVNLCQLTADKPVLIVNTASHCAFTSQFKGLESLHQKYKDRGLVVLGVPSDDFYQAADTAKEAADICFINYGVTFTMTEQQHVRGSDAHPVFRHLAAQSSAPAWNFNKYLVDAQGNLISHFGSMTKPDSDELNEQIDSLLNKTF